MGKRRRSKSEIIEVLRRLKASDQPIKAFAREEDLALSTLALWRRKYQEEEMASRLTRAGAIDIVGSSTIEVIHPSEWRVRIPASLPAERLEVALRTILSCSV